MSPKRVTTPATRPAGITATAVSTRILTGLQIDWQHKTMQFPDRVPANRRQDIENELFSHAPPDQGRETAYLRYWYGRIIDHYRGSGTKLIFLRVPRAAVSPPDAPPKLNSAVRQIAAQPDVIVLDERLFDQLEHPGPVLGWMASESRRNGAVLREFLRPRSAASWVRRKP